MITRIMAERFSPEAQLEVLRENVVIAEAQGILAAYSIYHTWQPGNLIAFTAQNIFDGVSVGLRQIKETGRAVRSSEQPIGFITAEFETDTSFLFSSDQLVVATERVRAEFECGLTQYVPARKITFIRDWLYLQH